MDPLSGGASALAFITIALQSTKLIYKTLAGIKDAPKQIQTLCSCASGLRLILHQLAKSSALQPGRAHYDLKPLISATKSCLVDVTKVEEQVKKLQASPSDKRLEMAWKRIKTVLGKNELDEMWKTLSQHTNILGLHVSTLSTEQEKTNHKSSLDRITDVMNLIKTQGTSLGLMQSEVLQLKHNVESSAASFNDSQSRHFETASDMCRSQVRDIKATLEQIRQEQADGLQHLSAKFEDIPDLSFQQYQALKQVLQNMAELQKEVSELRNSRLRHSIDQSSSNAEEELSTIVHRLSKFVHKKADPEDYRQQQSVLDDLQAFLDASIFSMEVSSEVFNESASSDEAESMINELENLFVSSSRQLHMFKDGLNEKKRKRQDDIEANGREKNLEHLRDFKRIRGMLASSWGLAINQPPTRRPRSSAIHYTQKRRTKKHRLRQGVMSVTSRTRQLRAKRDPTTASIMDESQLLEYDLMFQFMPTDPRLKTKLCARFCQFIGLDGTHTLLPILSTYMVVPKGSEVFILTMEGDIKGMKELIGGHKASLRDCDSDGRTLLTYACHFEQPEVCAFLLQHGADFDSIEPTFEDPEKYFPPLGHFRRQDFAVLYSPLTWAEDTERQASCKSILLDAGADPLAREQTEGFSPLQVSLQEGTHRSVHQLLREGRIHLDMEQQIDSDRTILLQHAWSYDGSNPEVISLLLEQGADVKARDGYGNTCLHLHIQALLRISPETSRGLDALVLLLKAGADPHSPNKDGVTPSALAYTLTEDDEDLGLGSYRADVWESALKLCNYDPTTMAGWSERSYKCTYLYTEYHYSALQHGITWDMTHHDYWLFQNSMYEHDEEGRVVSYEDESSSDLRRSDRETDTFEDVDENPIPRGSVCIPQLMDSVSSLSLVHAPFGYHSSEGALLYDNPWLH